MDRDSFVYHISYFKNIPREQKLDWIERVERYVMTGEKPAFDSNDWMLIQIWENMQNRIDAELAAYDKRCEYQRQYNARRKKQLSAAVNNDSTSFETFQNISNDVTSCNTMQNISNDVKHSTQCEMFQNIPLRRYTEFKSESDIEFKSDSEFKSDTDIESDNESEFKHTWQSATPATSSSVKKANSGAIKQITDTYCDTYLKIYGDKFTPVGNDYWKRMHKFISDKLKNYSLEQITSVINIASSDKWAIDKGFELTTILSVNMMQKYLNPNYNSGTNPAPSYDASQYKMLDSWE